MSVNFTLSESQYAELVVERALGGCIEIIIVPLVDGLHYSILYEQKTIGAPAGSVPACVHSLGHAEGAYRKPRTDWNSSDRRSGPRDHGARRFDE